MMLLTESPAESREQAPMDLKLKMILMVSLLLGTFGCSLSETRSQNRAIQSENRRVYEIYQQYMQSMNAQREMSGIPPQPIKSYEDWQFKNTNNKQTLKKTITVKGESKEVTYYWCTNHVGGKGMWVRHKPADCKMKDKQATNTTRATSGTTPTLQACAHVITDEQN